MSSFFQKLGFGLKKTSLNLSRGITDIFTKESLSEDVITDLEELLYTADVGNYRQVQRAPVRKRQ